MVERLSSSTRGSRGPDRGTASSARASRRPRAGRASRPRARCRPNEPAASGHCGSLDHGLGTMRGPVIEPAPTNARKRSSVSGTPRSDAWGMDIATAGCPGRPTRPTVPSPSKNPAAHAARSVSDHRAERCGRTVRCASPAALCSLRALDLTDPWPQKLADRIDHDVPLRVPLVERSARRTVNQANFANGGAESEEQRRRHRVARLVDGDLTDARPSLLWEIGARRAFAVIDACGPRELRGGHTTDIGRALRTAGRAGFEPARPLSRPGALAPLCTRPGYATSPGVPAPRDERSLPGEVAADYRDAGSSIPSSRRPSTSSSPAFFCTSPLS